MAKFLKINTFDNKYHLIRKKDILRVCGHSERESKIKSKMYLRDDTILNCTIDEHEILEIINK